MKQIIFSLLFFPLGLFAAEAQLNPATSWGDSLITVQRGRGHPGPGGKEAVKSGDIINGLSGRGYNGTAFTTTDRISIEMQASQDWTSVANGTKIVFKTTPDGSVTPATAFTINADGSTTFASTSVVSALTISGSTSSVDVFTVGAGATNDDPTARTQFARGATTDGNAATIWTIDLDADTTYLFEANVMGRRTGGTAGAAGDAAGYKVFGTISDVTGTATPAGAGTTTAITLEDTAGWTAAFGVSGGNVLLQVTGATDTNIVWHAEIRYMKVAS